MRCGEAMKTPRLSNPTTKASVSTGMSTRSANGTPSDVSIEVRPMTRKIRPMGVNR